MPQYKVQFSPIYEVVAVEAGTILLEAAGKAHIAIDSVCGGDGICGRCKMIVHTHGGRTKFVLAGGGDALRGREVAMFKEDIDNVITAKAAISAVARIVLARVDLQPSDADKLFVAGGFGNYINLCNAIAIGLFPDLPLSKVLYVGNTSVWGAKLAALSSEAREALRDISNRTTCYDLLGAGDYVEQLARAVFLPHTDVELFPSVVERSSVAQGES